MMGWWPNPSGMACDPRWARLSLAGRGLLQSLLDAADGARVIAWDDTSEQLALAVAGREDSAVVLRALAELFDVGFLYEGTGGLELHVRVSDRPTGDGDEQPAQQHQHQHQHQRAPTAPDGDERRTRAKRLHSRWTTLGLKTREARLAWLNTPAGAEVVRDVGLDLADARSIAEGTGQRRGTFGRDRDPRVRGARNGVPSDTAHASHGATDGVPSDTVNGARNGVRPVSPSRLSPSDRDGETNIVVPGAHGARDGARQTDSGVRADTVNGASPTTTMTDSQIPSGEKHTEYLHRLEQLSGGGFSASGGLDHKQDVAEMLSASGLADEDIAAALRTPELVWPKYQRVATQRMITAGMMAGERGPDGRFDCQNVAQLIAFVRSRKEPTATRRVESINYPRNMETEAQLAREKAARERPKDPVIVLADEIIRSKYGGARLKNYGAAIAEARAQIAAQQGVSNG